jgi:ATP-binding cassette subfamily E protein 1
LDRPIDKLSGGELQRFAIAATVVQEANMYIFDEPTSFLDIQQRLNAAKLIRNISQDPEKYVVVVEHDLSILEFMSDYVCLLYGTPGIYGVITLPCGVLEGLNMFLEGYIPSANLRFRPEAISFKVRSFGVLSYL